MTIQDTFNLAVEHHRAGRLAEAEGVYRQILAAQPNHAGAWNRLGLLAHQNRRHDEAAELIMRAIALDNANPEYPFNLGLVFMAQGRLEESARAYRRSLQLQPDSVPALCNLGIVLQQAGNVTEAIARFRQAIALQPNYAGAYNNLGSALRLSDDAAGSIAAFRRALELQPNSVEGNNNLANALYDLGQARQAMTYYQRAIAARPDSAQAHKGLGRAAQRVGLWDQAETAFHRAVALEPDDASAYWNLVQLCRLKKTSPGQAKVDSPLRLPYLGDKVVLLHCDRAVRERLRQAGLHGGYAIDPRSGGETWLMAQVVAQPDPQKLPALLGRWLDWIRNEAAMSDATCAVWMPDMPPAVADAVRQAAGSDLIEIEGNQADDIHARLCAMAVAPPDTEDKIFAVVSIRNGGVELLPHWLEHYTRLGVDKILVGVFDDLAGEFVQAIDQYAQRWKFSRFVQHWSTTIEAEQYSQRETGCRRAGARPQTWIMHTDLDELHQYPSPLRQITAAAGEKRTNAIVGHFVDRVAADGSLPPIQPRPSLWEQFPIECNVSQVILKSATQKVMLARYRVHVGVGHHFAAGEPVAPPPIGIASDYRVAHFKWHAALLPRLEWGLRQQSKRLQWQSEADRFMSWLQRHGGRMDLSDPALEARRAAPVS